MQSEQASLNMAHHQLNLLDQVVADAAEVLRAQLHLSKAILLHIPDLLMFLAQRHLLVSPL
jgi:hypothetical protein